MKVVFSEAALADLARIADYHTAWGSPELAAGIIRAIHRAIHLRAHVALARAARRDHNTDTFEIVVPRLPYIVVYRPMKVTLDIVAVFHTARHPSQKRRA